MEAVQPASSAFDLVNEFRTSGIILRTRRLTESSLIVHWLTVDYGRLATVAKGALRPKSAFRGKLDLFHEAELTLIRSRRSDLHTLKEISLRTTHSGLRRDLLALQQASYAAALIEQITETDAPTPELHELLSGLVAALAQTGANDAHTLAFEVKLLASQGLDPNADLGRAPLPVQNIIQQLAAGGDVAALLSAAQLRPAIGHLGRLLAYHFDRVPALRAQAFSSGGA